MSLLVQKFGGSSVADIAKIRLVAAKVKETVAAGNKVVVVVSAMQGQTDYLLGLAKQLTDLPNKRELDALLSTGEQVTTALLAIELLQLDCPACSYAGWQVPIITNDAFGKAQILSVMQERMLADLELGKVVIVAGFQGVDENGNITTLGRGGSDTTAVALAAALKADECQIYTDVDGVYSIDPRIDPKSFRLDKIASEEMIEFAGLGAKVLQIRAVEMAARHKLPLRVLSTFVENQGTLISYENNTFSNNRVTGIACDKQVASVRLRGVPDKPQILSIIVDALEKERIEIDMLSHGQAHNELKEVCFCIPKSETSLALRALGPIVDELYVRELIVDDKVAKISLVGSGLRSFPGIISKILTSLEGLDIKPSMLSVAETKVSLIIDETKIESAAKALHEVLLLG